jgi:hypothetical protein
MATESEVPTVFTHEDRETTHGFFCSLGEDLVAICQDLDIDPATIRRLGNEMGRAVQYRMDEAVITPPSQEVGAVVLGHIRTEWTPELAFSAGLSKKVDEIDPPAQHIQGELMMASHHGGSFTDGVVIPGGFYSELTLSGLFICDGDGTEYDGHADLAGQHGVWPND